MKHNCIQPENKIKLNYEYLNLILQFLDFRNIDSWHIIIRAGFLDVLFYKNVYLLIFMITMACDSCDIM